MTTGQLTLARRVSRPTRITVESSIPAEHAEMFFALYLEAFAPVRSRAVARQILHRDEFLAEMTDPRILKYVAWDDNGEPMGLTTLTRHLDAVTWISPEYFRHHYPEAFAEGRVYYLGFTLTRGGRRQYRFLAAMLAAVIDRLRAAKAVCGYDICAFNNDSMRFAEHLELMMHRLADVTVEQIDTQNYYSASFR
jgi:hypothetical protein